MLSSRVLPWTLKLSEPDKDFRVSICPLQHQDVPRAPLTAVKSDVLIAGVRVKPADALFVVEKI